MGSEVTKKALKWHDATSYSQSDKKREPKTFACDIRGFHLVVTRHRYECEPDEWMIECEPLVRMRRAKSKDIEEAKLELIQVVRKCAAMLVEELS